jgi:hypothetical protein
LVSEEGIGAKDEEVAEWIILGDGMHNIGQQYPVVGDWIQVQQ